MDYRQIIAEIVVQMLGFLIALWVLKLFAWKPLLKLLDDRRLRIRNLFKEIDDKNADIAKLKEDYLRHIANIEEEARRKIQQAVGEGRRIAAEIQDKARLDAKNIIEKAKQDIALEIAKAKVELKDDMARLAINAAEKVIQHELDEAAAEKIALGVIGDIEKMKQN